MSAITGARPGVPWPAAVQRGPGRQPPLPPHCPPRPPVEQHTLVVALSMDNRPSSL